jgi:hypothetical protein
VHHFGLHASDFEIEMHSGKPFLLAPVWLNPDHLLEPLGRTRALLNVA